MASELNMKIPNLIYKENIEQWINIYRICSDNSARFYAEKNYEEALKNGLEAVEIYGKIVDFLKESGTLNKKDLRVLESRFSESRTISDKAYTGLQGIKALQLNLGHSCRFIAEKYYDDKEYEKALEAGKLAVLFHPKDVFTNFALAKTLQIMKLSKEAAFSYEKVCEYDKNYHEGRRILGDLYFINEIADYDKSLFNYEHFLEHCPSNNYAHLKTNMVIIYSRLGMQESAESVGRENLEKNPGDEALIVTYLLNYLKIAGKSQEEIKRTTEQIMNIYIEAKKIEKNAYNFEERPKEVGKKLRIGYLSDDFGHHIVSRFIMPVIENHNKDKYEIFLYSNLKKEDSRTEEFKKLVGGNFIKCTEMSHQELADKIYSDKIDIIIDLNIHTGNSRICALISKPAPIQVVYLGYPNTSGIDSIDYILTCKDTIKPEEADGYTEKLAYIEAGYEVYRQDSAFIPEIKGAPFKKNGYITFGIYNAAAKVNNYTIYLWSQILNSVKNSKILFQYITYYTPENRKRIRNEFEKHGVQTSRILFEDKDPDTHYNKMQLADIALDTHPYSGTGTTFDSIIMGLPIVCFEGSSATSRPTARILKVLGCEELIAKNEEEYIAKAVEIACNTNLILNYRETLRDKIPNSNFVKFEEFTKSLEKTYDKMWADYCNS